MTYDSYPVTNAQYAPFVAAGGYDDERWWTAAGWAWRHGQEPAPDLSWIADEEDRNNYADWLASRTVDKRATPFFWDDEHYTLPTQPVIGITWYEAMAYSAWLNESGYKDLLPRQNALTTEIWAGVETGKFQVRLPTETEWEKAAGWDVAAGQKRIYPWGDDWDAARLNGDQTVGRPSPVGIFPAGASACGAYDMAGNVWEWTHSRWGGSDPNTPGFTYPFKTAEAMIDEDGRDDPDGDSWRVLRGGSWYDDQKLARVSSRNLLSPVNFSFDLSFRIVVAPVF